MGSHMPEPVIPTTSRNKNFPEAAINSVAEADNSPDAELGVNKPLLLRL
jgi:hypothetical protein